MITNLKKLSLGLSAVALTVGGIAVAQAPANPPKMERPKIDADGDGTVTRAEAQAAATAMFAKMDVNKDGKLDKADREQSRQQMQERRFAKLDANGDGSISKAEFTADRGPQGGPEGKGPPPPGGEGPGKDGRGMRGHHGGRGHGPHGGMMDADANKDGAISQAEFMAAAMKRFNAEDTNHDGKVTKEERKAQWEARKADRRGEKTADKKAAN